MRVLISVFKEDVMTGVQSFVYSEFLCTPWKVSQLESHLNLTEGYQLQITTGLHLSFFDLTLFADNFEQVLEKLIQIPKMEDEPQKAVYHRLFEVNEYSPGDVDAPVYDGSSNVVFQIIARYECGASGFSVVICKAAPHLWAVIRDGIIWDVLKSALCWLIGLLFNRRNDSAKENHNQYFYFNERAFYKNFSRTINLGKRHIQIIQLERVPLRRLRIVVRTHTGEKFSVECKPNGEIISFSPILDFSARVKRQ